MEKTVKYVFRDDYNPAYVNGAYGGVGANNEIVVHFYHERSPVPNSSSLTVSDGSVIEEFNTGNTDIVRYIQGGIILNLEAAKLLNSWLGSIIVSLEGQTNADSLSDDGHPEE